MCARRTISWRICSARRWTSTSRAEAVERALTASEPRPIEIAARAEDPLAAFADAYVSTTQREDPATGCGVAALDTDMPRVGRPAHEAYARRSSATSPTSSRC